MDEYTPDAFVNRDEPIPVVVLDHPDDHDLSDESDAIPDDRKRDRLRQHGKNLRDNFKKAQDKASDKGSSIQDRLLEKLLQQVIPIEDQSSSREQSFSSQSEFVTKPNFNLNTMSTNFRRFNARIGVVFVFQAKVIRLLSWTHPTHTLSFLAIYTFICLALTSSPSSPSVFLLLGLLIPAFISRHPAPPSTISPVPYSTTGPPLAPAPTVKPVKELSKDFFRNMRDLQNSMEDFSVVHDKLIRLLTPPTNFSNEPLSSTLFLLCFTTALALFIGAHLLPWRLIFLITGYFVTFFGHPTLQRMLMSTHKTYVVPKGKIAESKFQSWITHDIILDSAPQTREVEIFELQHLSPSLEWTPWLFTPSPYDPLSSTRIRGERPAGTRFFEDVKAPAGWEWEEKKWALDLWSREWVEERIITGVEVETEGERWVYDLRYEDEGSDDYNTPSTPRKGEAKRVLPSWEEGSDAEGD
ncbi:Peroxisomal membrane protein PEX29, partial [Lachnellula suecica]